MKKKKSSLIYQSAVSMNTKLTTLKKNKVSREEEQKKEGQFNAI